MISINSDKKFDEQARSFFVVNSRGFETARDFWVYTNSKILLLRNIESLTKEYRNNFGKEKDELNYDPTKISWSSSLIADVKKHKEPSAYTIRDALYRPYFKQNVYFGETFIHRMGQMKEIFPTPAHKNLVICVSGLGGTKQNTTIITNLIPDLNCLDAGTQCFPLYWYEENKNVQTTLFGNSENDDKYIRHDGITDWILKEIRARYHVNSITKEMIFYYVYGILHSKKYRERFAPDLKKSLPRLPIVENINDFMAFSEAGRQLAQLHLYYESVPPCESVSVQIQRENYLVEKMRFPQKRQKDTIIYNGDITISNIPAEAYEYVVNGKSAIEWIMERYQITVDKDSGIRNDPNDWAREHNQPRYILDLLLSVIELSVQTAGIVNALPEIDWEKE